ncbi:head-tail connector protein [Methylocystis sp. JAN1]|uniref:head-tail connector protein n=1 Tax=Methylocystis sp. JAN1 TaxID=3397211 RepID=UPI003FA2197A
MRPMLIGAPAIEPVSLAEAKLWLREDGGEEDQLIQALIVSARMTLEAYTRRFFVTQSWRLVFDSWPRSVGATSTLAIPFAPFQSVVAIRVFDANDNVQIVPATSYRAPGANDGGRVIFNPAPPAAGRSADGVEIDFVVGYGALASQTPEPLRRAILILAAHWREKRGDDADDPLPKAVAQLAAPYRRERLL